MTRLPSDAAVDQRLTPARPRRLWLRILASIGAGVLVLLALGVGGLLWSRHAFAEIKPEALRVANEFAACSLAQDRLCVLRLSTWDDATYDKGVRIVDAVNRKLGKRGAANLDEKSVRYSRNAGVGAHSLRWRIQLQLAVDYEHDASAKELFLLEDHGQGLQVVHMNWNSDKLLP